MLRWCSFEGYHGTNCDLEDDLTSDFTWSEGTGPSVNPATGPTADYNEVGGTFKYIDSSSGQPSGAKARYVLPHSMEHTRSRTQYFTLKLVSWTQYP